MNKIKISFSILLMPLLLSGCIGRIITYDTDFSKKIVVDNSTNIIKPNLSYKNFIKRHNPKLAQEKIDNLAVFIAKYSKENEVDPKLVLSVMARESSFRADVVSPSGAVGLGQLLPSTAKDMGVDDAFNPEENTKATVKYIAWLLKKWNGDVDKTLASYKIGLGTVGNLIKKGEDYPEDTKSYIQDIKNYKANISDES
jgi:soluble lytic murein transglycosylase-like protein